MEIFCLEDFRKEYEKLKKKSTYKSIEDDVINYFFNKTALDLSSGTRLNNSVDTPYIKKRINGSGGFRFYYLLLIKNDKLYLLYVHPKTGPYGADNITDKSKAILYKKVLEAIQSNNLYKVIYSEDKKLVFESAS